MTRWATGLVSFVILFHCAAFLLEACFWMQPSVHEAVLPRLTGLALPAAHEQARILEALFVSQGFYNLFLASAGMVGLVLSTCAVCSCRRPASCVGTRGAAIRRWRTRSRRPRSRSSASLTPSCPTPATMPRVKRSSDRFRLACGGGTRRDPSRQGPTVAFRCAPRCERTR
jgi:uncharacterized membrane protein